MTPVLLTTPLMIRTEPLVHQLDSTGAEGHVSTPTSLGRGEQRDETLSDNNKNKNTKKNEIEEVTSCCDDVPTKDEDKSPATVVDASHIVKGDCDYDDAK